jgi:hypothetical protein
MPFENFNKEDTMQQPSLAVSGSELVTSITEEEKQLIMHRLHQV